MWLQLGREGDCGGRFVIDICSEERICGIAVPSERPGEPGQCHHQQEDSGVESQRHMTVIPEPVPAFVERHPEAVFEGLAVARYPDDQSAQEYDHHDDGTDPYNDFPSGFLSFGWRRVHQPAVYLPYRLEERIGLCPPEYLACVRIDGKLALSRLSERGQRCSARVA